MKQQPVRGDTAGLLSGSAELWKLVVRVWRPLTPSPSTAGRPRLPASLWKQNRPQDADSDCHRGAKVRECKRMGVHSMRGLTNLFGAYPAACRPGLLPAPSGPARAAKKIRWQGARSLSKKAKHSPPPAWAPR